MSDSKSDSLQALGVGPYGHHLTIRVHAPETYATKERVEAAGLTYLGQAPDGRTIFEYRTRAMKLGDDETRLWELAGWMREWFGNAAEGWNVDWKNSTY